MVLAVGLTACASSTPAPPPLDTNTDETSGLFRPDQIAAILAASGIEYVPISDMPVARQEVPALMSRPSKNTGPMDPFVEVKRRPDGRPHLESSRPGPEVEALFDAGTSACEARDFEAARTIYARAVELAPDYFKAYTYLGNSLYQLGDYRRAEVAFERALSINPIDYQALLFLGDTYYQLGDYGRSKSVLTRAFMINRDNPAVLERLQAALAKLSLRVRDVRLAPPVKIQRVAHRRVEMRFDKDQGLRWLALAACMACWAYEDECRGRSPVDEDPLRLQMHRECLINQAASIAVRRAHEEELGVSEGLLLDAIEDGYLEAIIFWEIIASHAPVVILLLPEAVQADILEYIERYVFQTTQVVELTPTRPAPSSVLAALADVPR